MRIIPLLLFLLLAWPARADDWTVGPAPSDDPAMTAATVLNADGHALFLWSRSFDDRHQLFAELHLARGESFGGVMPSYRIDGGDSVDTDAVRQQGEELGAMWGSARDGVAFWLAWTSIQPAILPTDRLADWLKGRELEIAWRGADGREKTTRFPLAGVADALHRATQLETP